MITLRNFEPLLKKFLISYLIVVTIGLTLGLYFVRHTTDLTPSGTVERFRGDEVQDGDEFTIPENYPRPISELLVTTHNHILGFSFIFGSVGLIFYFNSRVKGFWKTFLLIEPFVSIITSFGSIWLIRFVHPAFVYLTIISALLLYISFYVMVYFSLTELLSKKYERLS
ncbi:MAG: hypothetical protein QY331_10335 [Melioribacteraceae bacterium]|nr:MAG: hypothetical protein QY331_10335 [Melioribacteraceae bacterium]